MVKLVKKAKDSNSRDFWLLNDRAADYYNKNLKGTKDGKRAALERICLI